MKRALSERGQITIPKKIREKLGLVPGQVIEFEARGGLLIGRKNLKTDSLEGVVGILRGRLSDVDAYLDETRGPRHPRK